MLTFWLGPSTIPPGKVFNTDMAARSGKRSICVSPKTQRGLEIIRKLVRSADVLIDPYRPGTLERLHLGPSDCMATNSRLIYARLVGYTPTSHYQDMAGHDINYLALSGVLSVSVQLLTMI